MIKIGLNILALWSKCGQNMAKIWSKFGQNMAIIWSKYTPGPRNSRPWNSRFEIAGKNFCHRNDSK